MAYLVTKVLFFVLLSYAFFLLPIIIFVTFLLTPVIICHAFWHTKIIPSRLFTIFNKFKENVLCL